MKLLERYLQAVARCLPKARRDDIIEELRVNLLSQFEDREEELGHPLTVDEQAEILRRHGNPTMVASSYGTSNLGFAFGVQLIGPELFPIYRNVLGTIMSISLILLAIVIPTVLGTTHEAITLARILTPVIIQFFATTLIFILIDHGKGHVLNRWDPRTLPAVKPSTDEGPTLKNIFTFLFMVIGTVWLAMAPRWPFLVLGPGALYLPALSITFWPQWPVFYAAIMAMLGARLVLEFFKLFQQLPKRMYRICDLGLRGFEILVGVALFLVGPHYVTSPYKEVADWGNQGFQVFVAITVAINLWHFSRRAWSLIRERHQMLPAGQN